EISPRAKATLILRLAVSGRPGVPEHQRIRFTTNDPRNPAVEILTSVTPVARYFATPATMALGTVAAGDRFEGHVDIMAFGRGLPEIRHAVSSNDHIRVEYRPIDSSAETNGETKSSELMGRLRIVLQAPTAPADVEGVVSLFCDGCQEPVVAIPVTGRIARL